MRGVSDRFLRTIRGSHRARVQAFIVEPGQYGTQPEGTEVTVLSGDVQYDAKAAIRGTLDITIDGTGLFPNSASDLLTPYGNEIFVRRGIAFSGGTVEWVSLGYFRITTVEQDEAPDGPIRISAQDRMVGVVEARFTGPHQYDAGDWTYGEIVTDAIKGFEEGGGVYEWAEIDWLGDEAENDLLGRTLYVDDPDRFKFVDDLVKSLGKIWYWDYRGILVIKDAPDPDEIVWEVDAGENGVLISLSRTLTREGVYNVVVATGEGIDTEPPAWGVASDRNPDSPTHIHGTFGQVPRFFSSPFIVSDLQARLAAAALLRENLGLPYSVDFTQVPNPALEPYDPILVKFDGRTERHIIETLTIPLSVEQPIHATTREQTLVVIGTEDA